MAPFTPSLPTLKSGLGFRVKGLGFRALDVDFMCGPRSARQALSLSGAACAAKEVGFLFEASAGQKNTPAMKFLLGALRCQAATEQGVHRALKLIQFAVPRPMPCRSPSSGATGATCFCLDDRLLQGARMVVRRRCVGKQA